jgi:hypothetical protein
MELQGWVALTLEQRFVLLSQNPRDRRNRDPVFTNLEYNHDNPRLSGETKKRPAPAGSKIRRRPASDLFHRLFHGRRPRTQEVRGAQAAGGKAQQLYPGIGLVQRMHRKRFSKIAFSDLKILSQSSKPQGNL